MMGAASNLYLIHGWQVGEGDRNIVLFMKGEEAMSLGISLTISKNGKNSFVGKLLGTVAGVEGEEYVGVKLPNILDAEKLKLDIQTLGLKVLEEPLLYMVAA